MRALAALLAISIVLAGCSDGGGDGGEPSASASTSSSATGGPAPTFLLANLTADVVNGTAPLSVTFTVNATGALSAWRLSFGDGNSTNGTKVPAAVNHTYLIGGNFTATLTVTGAGNGTGTDNVTIAVTVPAGKAAPDVLAFEYGESLGCAGDAGADNCISFIGGPDASGVDGYWQAVDERYWGLAFTTSADQAAGQLNDTDCAITDADHAILEEPNNGSGPCTGVVPAGAAWIFLYPYAVPSMGMTLTFTA